MPAIVFYRQIDNNRRTNDDNIFPTEHEKCLSNCAYTVHCKLVTECSLGSSFNNSELKNFISHESFLYLLTVDENNVFTTADDIFVHVIA